MEIDRALLTDEQKRLYYTWQEFFDTTCWQTMVQDAERQTETVERALAQVKGAQGLGYLQGQLSVLRWITRQQNVRFAYLANEFGVFDAEPQEQDSDPAGLA
jgi:hypothetical protein